MALTSAGSAWKALDLANLRDTSCDDSREGAVTQLGHQRELSARGGTCEEGLPRGLSGVTTEPRASWVAAHEPPRAPEPFQFLVSLRRGLPGEWRLWSQVGSLARSLSTHTPRLLEPPFLHL